MQEDDEQQFDIGNQDHFDNAPEEMKDHLMAAFLHKAGKGSHPGKYAGPQPHPPSEEAITEGDLQRAHEEGEISSRKMKAAMRGGDLGPGQFEQQEAKQAGALQQASAVQGQQQAAQAQGSQQPVNPPPAPAGPAGTSTPYPAQAKPGAVPTTGNMPSQDQGQGQGEAPEQPGP